MKQLLQNLRDGEGRVEEVPVPALLRGRVLVRTAASLVSAGTERGVVELGRKSLLGKARERPDLVRKVVDKIKSEGLTQALGAVRDKLSESHALGYSASGVVAEVGEGVESLRAGDRVACAGAGYASHAEVLSVPKNLCVRLPDGVDFESGAFATLGAIALQGVRLAEPTLGESCVVIGLGLVGQLTAQLLSANGCRVFGVDLDPARVDLARALGAQDGAVPGEGLARAVEDWTRGRGADAVVVTAATQSNGPVEWAGEISRRRGRVVVVGLVGMDVPRKSYFERELTLRVSMSYGPGRYDPEYEERGHDYPLPYVRWTEGRNLEAFLDLVAAGRVRTAPLVTHRFPIEEGERAYKLISGDAGEPYLGVLLTYDNVREPARGVARHAGAETHTAADAATDAATVATGAASVTSATNATGGTTAPSVTSAASATGGATTGGAAADGATDSAATSAETNAAAGRATVAAAGRAGSRAGRVRLGVVGAGGYARGVLLPAFRAAGAEFRALATATGVSARDAGERFDFARLAATAEEVIDDPEVNLVVVATRHDTHAALARRALEAGKHVFVEKPLALSDAELDALLEAAARSRGRLMAGFNRRFAPLAVRAREFFADRRAPLSILYRVNAGRVPREHWTQDAREGGGRIVGEVCHFVDLMQFFAGSPPVRVFAECVESASERVVDDDSVFVTVRFADGSNGCVAYLAEGDRALQKERIEIFGGGRSLVIEDFRAASLFAGGREERVKLRAPDKGQAAEARAACSLVLAGADAPVALAELEATTRATFRILDSLRTGLPVELG
jgi:predicted dehydrogenase/threonine dehydrogenase-like Zn-dependent dehydrogenase